MSRVTGIAIDVHPSGAQPPTVTAGAGAWTYGSWVEVIASAAADLHLAGLVLAAFSLPPSNFEVQIGIGAGGSEAGLHTFRTDLRNTAVETKNQFALFPVPVGGITAGDRVSVRIRSSSGSESIDIGLATYASLTDTDHLTSKAMVSAPSGANSASITPSGTAWNYSAWTEVFSGAAVETAILGLVLRGPVASEQLEYEIGFGAAGSEVPKTMIRTHQDSSADFGGFRNFYLPAAHPVPANTRVAVRLRKTGTSTTVHSVAMLYLNDTAVNVVEKTASESITVTDAVSAVLSTDLYLTVAEAISVVESVTLRPSAILLSVAESVGIADDASIPLGGLVSDRVFVRDFVEIAPSRLVIVAVETISVTEGPLNRNPEGVTGSLGPEPSAPAGSTGLADYWVVGL